jgi:mono/diheme cytochrome c family protein
MSGVATDDDLRRVIVHGINGSGMPAFNQLDERQVQSLILVLDSMWNDRPDAADPVVVPPRPAPSAALVAEGKELFAENCSLCHGARGLGNGEAAGSIVDARGHQVRPRNLVADAIKGGAGSTQLYTRIAAGIPAGDGQYLMPQWAELGPEKIWALVSFLEAELLPRRTVADARRVQ